MTTMAHVSSRGRSWAFGPDFGMPLAVAIGYYLGAQASFFIGTLSDKMFAPFWPPNIVLFCALLLAPLNRWWLFFIAVLPAHVIAELSVGMDSRAMTVAFVSNCLVSAMAASSMRFFIGTSDWLSTLRNAALYFFLAVAVVPGIAAFGGAMVQVLNTASPEPYGPSWTRWYASNALGFATLGPVALILLDAWRRRTHWHATWRHAEMLGLGAALIAMSMLSFGFTDAFRPAGYLPTLVYLPLPLVLLATVRFGVAGATGSVLVLGAILLWRTMSGRSLFDSGDAQTNVFAVQIFLVALAVPVTMLGAAIEDSRRGARLTRESEDRMAFAAASSNIGLWIYTFDTATFWATEHSRTMFGLSPRAAFGIDQLLSRIHPGDVELASSAFESAITSRASIGFEVRIQEKDDRPRWISVKARPHRDTEGNIIELTGTFVDVSARKAAQEEALMRQQEVGHLMRVSMLAELSGGLAHELTQPLTAILSNAQAGRMLLDSRRPDLLEIAGIFDDIITEDGRAGEVIHRLRGLLKKGEVRDEEVEINALIESTLHLLHSEVISRRVKISTVLAPELPLARGDPIQLQQVLLNLVLNAIDAMEELPTSRRVIMIRSGFDDLEIEVSICDRGTGLPQAPGEDPFKPFYTTKRRGLGIGLSICNSIIKSHGGTLALKNNADDGATAAFRLPSQSMM